MVSFTLPIHFPYISHAFPMHFPYTDTVLGPIIHREDFGVMLSILSLCVCTLRGGNQIKSLPKAVKFLEKPYKRPYMIAGCPVLSLPAEG